MACSSSKKKSTSFVFRPYTHIYQCIIALGYRELETNCSGSFFTSPDSSIYHCDSVIVSQFMPHQKTVHKLIKQCIGVSGQPGNNGSYARPNLSIRWNDFDLGRHAHAHAYSVSLRGRGWWANSYQVSMRNQILYSWFYIPFLDQHSNFVCLCVVMDSTYDYSLNGRYTYQRRAYNYRVNIMHMHFVNL